MEVFIPKTLQAMQNWCVWKLEKKGDRFSKIPYALNGKMAKSNDRRTWSSFEAITELLSADSGKNYKGYGFMISDGFVFVDCDHCVSYDGKIDKRGQDVLSAFPLSFAEISQSGSGLHILTRGRIPRGFNNRSSGVEMYSARRFCAVTGNAIQALEPTDEQDGLDYVFNKYSTGAGKTIATYSRQLPTGISSNTDRWVITHAMNIKGQRGRDFQTLFSGDISSYESASEADSALCVLLAFWCDRDQAQIDRIFRQSRLYRPKWEREDYRNRTISHACDHIPETLSEWLRRNQHQASESASVMRFLMYGGQEHGRE